MTGPGVTAVRETDRQTARVTLECGHVRLMRWIDAAMGVGSFTACFICPLDYTPEQFHEKGRNPTRLVVDHEDAMTPWSGSMASERDRH